MVSIRASLSGEEQVYIVCIDSEECGNATHVTEEESYDLKQEDMYCWHCDGLAVLYTDNYWLDKKSYAGSTYSAPHGAAGEIGGTIDHTRDHPPSSDYWES